MAAVYSRQNTAWQGSFATDNAVLLAGGVLLGIVQNMQIQFAQQVARIYDVTNGGGSGVAVKNGAAVFYVGGRTNGQVTIARVLGPSGKQKNVGDFYSKFGDICNPTDLSFSFVAGCGEKAVTTTYSVQAAVLTNIGITVAAQDMIINENLTMMFANLDVPAPPV